MTQSDPFLISLHEWISVFMRRSMQNVMRHTRDCGWSMSQLGTLMIIHRRGTTAVSEIGEELGVTNAAASQMLDRLVNEGLIYRTEDPNDRRVKQIKLTEKGRRIIQESFEARHGWLIDLADNLSSSEKEQARQTLHVLTERARKFEETIEPVKEQEKN